MTDSQTTTSQETGNNGRRVTVTGEGKVMTTDFGQGTTVTVLLPPPTFLEALEYTNDFYTDGRLQAEGDEDGPTERVRLAAGEGRQIGAWLWAAGPHALVGVRVND